MTYDRILFAFLFLLILSVTYGQEWGQPTCYGKVCPTGTLSCSKLITSSINRAYLRVSIKCLDESNKSLKNHKYEVKNELGPYTFYESTSFTSVAYDNNYLEKTNDELEDLS